MDAVLGWVASPGRDAKPFQVAGSRELLFFGVGVGAAWPPPVVRVVRGLLGVFGAACGFAPAEPALSRGCGILFS
jgi:hypothetical protein